MNLQLIHDIVDDVLILRKVDCTLLEYWKTFSSRYSNYTV